MNRYYHIIVLLLLISFANLCAQNRHTREFRQSYTAPEEIVSLSGTMPFHQSLLIFNDLSKKFLNKIIVDPENRNIPIGVDVNRMHWMDALELILKTHDLWYEESADYFKIVATTAQASGLSTEEKKSRIAFLQREVVFSAIFFETNNAKLREAGMSWDFFRGKDINLTSRLTAADSRTGLYEININPDFDFGSLLAVFKSLENDQIGEVIASPQITVKSDQEGRIQVGSDIAVTMRDFAGNTVTQFFSTGSIIEVRPTVIRHDSIDFINVELKVERSNSSTGTGGLEIKKSKAETSVILLDGEETIIGGLYVNEENITREGVPLLKDLPWWFLGARYLFGYESKSVIKNELLILIKAELLPTLEDRFSHKMKALDRQNLLRDGRKDHNRDMEFYKHQWKKGRN